MQIWLLGALGALILGMGMFFYGQHLGYAERTAEEITAERHQAEVVAATVKHQEAVTAEWSNKGAEHQAQIETVTRTIIREVPVYVTPQIDRDFPLPWGFVRVHDAAALRIDVPAIPLPTGQSDASRSPVTASVAAGTIAENYGRADGNAQQLNDLEAWIRDQQAITAQPEH